MTMDLSYVVVKHFGWVDCDMYSSPLTVMELSLTYNSDL